MCIALATLENREYIEDALGKNEAFQKNVPQQNLQPLDVYIKWKFKKLSI